MIEARNTSIKAIVFRTNGKLLADISLGCLMPCTSYYYESNTRIYLAYPSLEYSLMIEIITGWLLSKI